METLSSIEYIKNLDSGNFFLLAGPCVVEGETITREIAERIKGITDRLKIPFIFKASYRRQTVAHGLFQGIGDAKALDILNRVRGDFKIPIVTDIHSVEEAQFASQVVDVLQIPAFLCRQTDLLIAAAETNRVVNIKKGQFLSPEAMEHAANKVVETGNRKVMLTERGTTFGYQDLVVDFRGIPIMKSFGHPVVVDITHSLQQPNQSSGVTGGKPKLIELMAKTSIAAGADGLFIETHPNPSKALSDGANMLPLAELELLLERIVKLRKTVNEL